MSDADRTVSRVTVRILDKEYAIACPPEEKAALLESVEVLSGKILFGFTTSIVWFVLLAIIFALILDTTPYGNRLFAVGGKRNCAVSPRR